MSQCTIRPIFYGFICFTEPRVKEQDVGVSGDMEVGAYRTYTQTSSLSHSTDSLLTASRDKRLIGFIHSRVYLKANQVGTRARGNRA
ncbi:hypothetical protein RRG08_036011 [Elysia crispata]|uniref:Uncharacterized protein n=1 Tax=Elysia crispata TaxID=231223 RepID=A0AAE1E1T8_9GAST|nr:hypothetical protein RRG08_036011 [Elysia crispata]